VCTEVFVDPLVAAFAGQVEVELAEAGGAHDTPSRRRSVEPASTGA
jgi:hypothetical protein